MKKIFSIVVVVLLSITIANAQGYKKGVNNINAGVGFGLAGIYGNAGMIPISVGVQIGVANKISFGGIVGFSTSTYGLDNFEWKYTYIMLGARGEYHFLKPTNKLDAYAGLTLGYNIVSVTAPSNYSGFGYSAQGSYLLFGVHVGARYAFTRNIGAFAELGYGIGYLTVGVNFKI